MIELTTFVLDHTGLLTPRGRWAMKARNLAKDGRIFDEFNDALQHAKDAGLSENEALKIEYRGRMRFAQRNNEPGFRESMNDAFSTAPGPKSTMDRQLTYQKILFDNSQRLVELQDRLRRHS